MSKQNSDRFYSDLPTNGISINQLIIDQTCFSTVPDDWQVVVTDVIDSTGAIKRGLHQVVNLVATGCIIAGLNLARKAGVSIPFFFGGDGATLLVPPVLLDKLMAALNVHKENTLKNFNIKLRLAHFLVADIYKSQHELLISKVKRSEKFHIPLVLGNGLQAAEKLLKQERSSDYLPAKQIDALDLTGMECRWNLVDPPNPLSEVMCLLVVACHEEQQAYVYKKVLDKIDDTYGILPNRNPISEKKLKIRATLKRLGMEMSVKLGRVALGYWTTNWLMTLAGYWYLRYDKVGKNYIKRLVELSDTLVLDGKINTVISGTAEQRKELVDFLHEMEENNEIVFGWHACRGSIMSCYVRDRLDQHIHFVDGCDGGYTKAAGMYKRKRSLSQ